MTSPEFELAMTRTEYDAAIKSLTAASKLAARYQGERDAALAAVARVSALCDHASDYEQPDFADAIRVALIEDANPRPWTVPAPATQGKPS